MIAAATAQVWGARELEARRSWQRRVPRDVAAEFEAFCGAHPRAAADLDAFELESTPLPALRAWAGDLRGELLEGSGLAWIRSAGELALSEAERRLFYLALGSALGEPMTHYGRLYEVRDRGDSYLEKAIPVSQTGAPTGFHTDSSRLDCIPDFVGLLCEEPSVTGGGSLVSNALRALEVLRERNPEALDVLLRPLVRDLVTPGVEKTDEARLANRFPVFAPCERREGVVFRYMRYWIERGQERVGAPLGDRELAALDVLDEVLGAPENVVRFHLAKGDIAWFNNRTLAHNRDGYTDSSTSTRRLQRMWVQLRD